MVDRFDLRGDFGDGNNEHFDEIVEGTFQNSEGFRDIEERGRGVNVVDEVGGEERGLTKSNEGAKDGMEIGMCTGLLVKGKEGSKGSGVRGRGRVGEGGLGVKTRVKGIKGVGEKGT